VPRQAKELRAPDNPLFSFEQKINKLISEVYYAGQSQAAAAIVRALERNGRFAAVPVRGESRRPRRGEVLTRAPRGTSKTLVMRVLATGPHTATQIAAKAQTRFEKMLTFTAIYLELRRGQKEKRYISDNGRWSLAQG
jgi:hypothetical protein